MGLGDQIERKLVQMLRRAETLLSRHRPDVFAVAHALETYKTISGDDIIAILDGTKGPVVDGRLYQLPEVQRALEANHEDAAAAHRENRHSQVELPELTATWWTSRSPRRRRSRSGPASTRRRSPASRSTRTTTLLLRSAAEDVRRNAARPGRPSDRREPGGDGERTK